MTALQLLLHRPRPFLGGGGLTAEAIRRFIAVGEESSGLYRHDISGYGIGGRHRGGEPAFRRSSTPSRCCIMAARGVLKQAGAAVYNIMKKRNQRKRGDRRRLGRPAEKVAKAAVKVRRRAASSLKCPCRFFLKSAETRGERAGRKSVVGGLGRAGQPARRA